MQFHLILRFSSFDEVRRYLHAKLKSQPNRSRIWYSVLTASIWQSEIVELNVPRIRLIIDENLTNWSSSKSDSLRSERGERACIGSSYSSSESNRDVRFDHSWERERIEETDPFKAAKIGFLCSHRYVWPQTASRVNPFPSWGAPWS